MVTPPLFEASIFMAVKDAESNDLLNPATSGYIDAARIKLSYLNKDGEVKEAMYTAANPMDSYYGFGDLYFFYAHTLDGLIYNKERTSAVSTDYLTWPDGTVDTFECKYNTPGSSVLLEEVIVNGSLRWRWNDIIRDDGSVLMSSPYFLVTIDGDSRTISILPYNLRP